MASFRIRQVTDTTLPASQRTLEAVQRILRERFPGLAPGDVDKLPAQLVDPLRFGFRYELYVAEEGTRGELRGFALALHESELEFYYLDFVSTPAGATSGGVGGALYERVREAARAHDTIGVFLECLPDDPELCPDPEVRTQNRARLRFYERFGARPIEGTAYETPITPGDDNPPLLVYDDLGSGRPLRRAEARRIVRAVLERKYRDLCPPEYVKRVVESFRDDPVRLRPYRYVRAEQVASAVDAHTPEDQRIVLVVNEAHSIHHVRERGYVEAPARVRSIVAQLDTEDRFRPVPAREHPERHIRAVHDGALVDYVKRVCAQLETGKSVYPYVFPVRNAARPPKELAVRAGYFCIDTFTPLNRNAWLAARGAVNCTLTAADALEAGARIAYALVRPPGHHAERKVFGGFCYFNNAAIAAHHLTRLGRVAILDVDYHHGNGQQDIFYERDDVLTVSIHGHPSFAYPYFSGFREETGSGAGLGANRNLPLPERLDGAGYRAALSKALDTVRRAAPDLLVVALGLDTARADPTGTWSLTADDFEVNGRMIGELGLPTLVVQEGGYRVRTLGSNARRFFAGLWSAQHGSR